MPLPVTDLRVRVVSDEPVRDGAFVIYWMIGQRRLTWNHALQHAAHQARTLRRGLLIVEPLDADYPHASPRFHTFVIQGMDEHRQALRGSGVGYLPYVEPAPGAGRGLLHALAEHACLIVTDDYPGRRPQSLLQRAAQRLSCRLEAVDSYGVVPLALLPKERVRAVDFRRDVHKAFAAGDLPDWPLADPLVDLPPCPAVPDPILERWPAADPSALLAPGGLDALPLDVQVGVVRGKPGGASHGQSRLSRFLDQVERYPEGRHPDADATSGLSPWLHFGHLGGAQVIHDTLERTGFDPARMDRKAAGKQQGGWGVAEGAESFLEEVVIWRELAAHAAWHHPDDNDRYEGLPEWARNSLESHAGDRRQVLDLDALTWSRTPDPIWNAAQRQLRETGTIHSYIRMLWGKNVLAWTASPRQAFDTLVQLNDRWALDGRDPSSYAGIAWVLGRFDRAWGPERPIFGKIRYMTSDATRRKLRLDRWLARFGS